MQTDDNPPPGCIFVFFILVFALMVIGGFGIGRHWEQRKAVEAGAGKWVVDPKTGDTTFEYVKPGE